MRYTTRDKIGIAVSVMLLRNPPPNVDGSLSGVAFAVSSGVGTRGSDDNAAAISV